MSALDQELGRTDKFREPPPLTDQPRTIVDFITLQLSKVNWRAASRGLAVAGGLVVFLIIALIVRHHYQTADPLAHLEPGVYKSAQSGETLPLPATPHR